MSGDLKLENRLLTHASINDMTADKFFRYCEIGYDANDYFKEKQSMSPRSKYKAMADGRDGGLTGIVGDSQEDFED